MEKPPIVLPVGVADETIGRKPYGNVIGTACFVILGEVVVVSIICLIIGALMK